MTTRPHTNRDDVSDLERLREDYDEYKRHASCGHSYATLPGFVERADALRAALEAELAQEKAEVKCLRYYKSRYDKMRPERDTAMAANKVANALLKRAEADADTQFKLRAQAEAEVQRLRVAEAEAMNILEGTELKLEQAEADLQTIKALLDEVEQREARRCGTCALWQEWKPGSWDCAEEWCGYSTNPETFGCTHWEQRREG